MLGLLAGGGGLIREVEHVLGKWWAYLREVYTQEACRRRNTG